MPIFGSSTESIIFPTATPKVVIATSIGISLSAIFAGSNYAVSYIALPSLLLPAPTSSTYLPSASTVAAAKQNETPKAGTPPAHLARQWQKMYHLGSSSLPIVALGSAASFLVACVSIPESLKTQRALYVSAAILSVSVAPFTWAMMQGTNDELKLRAKAATEDNEAADKRGEETEVMGAGYQTQGLISHWGGLNVVRASLPLVAAGCAVTALVW